MSTCTPPITRQSNGKSIGVPVAGRCWVVDPENANVRVPPGGVGELLVEGPHVGRGYLGEPEKTAAVFIGRPIWHTRLFPAECDARALRFYRTGDLVVNEPDGSFTFVGRKDEQVKVNGQRIELGEIEHQFKRAMLPPRDIVVELVKRKVSGGATRGSLVAFVALDSDWEASDEAANQRRLDAEMAVAEKEVHTVLPKFMMPASFVAVQRIPISINGKVDRKGLRALGEARLFRKQNAVASPSFTPAEEQLRQVWSRVLNVSEGSISRTSVFQTLGGDSISAMQVVSQAAARGIRITVQSILQKKTIEAIASGSIATPPSSIITTPPTSEDEEDEGEPFKLSPIQQLFFHLSPQGDNQDNISFLLRLDRSLSRNTVDHALEAVVSRNPMLRSRFFEMKRGNWFQYISDDTLESYHLSTHTIDDTSSDMMQIIKESQRGIDIKYGPLFRADLFTVQGGKEQFLFVCAHHLVTDFVSWRVILQQLEEHITTGVISSPKGYSFQKWAKVQEKRIRSLPPQELPFQLPSADYAFWGMQGTPNVYGDSETETLLLDEDLSSVILGAASNSSLEFETMDVLLSAAMFAFHTTFPERQVPAFFVEGHGREPSWDDSIDLSSTVGWFTTLLPIVMSEQNCTNPVDALQETKALRAQFTDKGLAHFASHYYQRKKSSRYPPMEITFNYAGQYQQLERAGGLFSEVPGATLMHLGGFGAALPRFGLVEVLGNVERGRVKLSFTVNARMRHRERVTQWMHACRDVLAMVAEQFTSPHARHFPLLRASPTEMTRLVERVLPGLGVRSEDVEDAYPCSPMQNGMLLSRAGERGSYTSQLFFEAKATDDTPIDMARLARAWQAVVNRHAVLRTIFVESVRGDGSFDQIVLHQATASITHAVSGPLDDDHHPIPTWPANHPEHHLIIAPGKDASHALLRLDISHVLIDGSSTPTLTHDLRAAYAAPDALSLATPKPAYSAYIAHISSLSHAAAVQYWTAHLAGAQPCHLPPWTSDDDEAQAQPANTLALAAVPPINAPKTTAFCRAHGVTLSDLLKTAWALVLRAYTGAEAPVFGYLSSGRGDEENALGVFTNIQPCLARLREGAEVVEVLRAVQEEGIEQMPYRECPLAEVVHALGGVDGEGGLFGTAMSLQRVEAPSREVERGGVEVRVVREMDPTEVSAR